EVKGEVEWLLNRTDKGWLVALFNPAGANKPQHGVQPTDYAQKRTVTIRTAQPVNKVVEWFGDPAVTVSRQEKDVMIRVDVPACASPIGISRIASLLPEFAAT